PEIACVIVEPIAANMGVVPPEPSFLDALRARCDEEGALLIFDEVVTGFRVGRHGAQGMFGVRPDLTVLGKIIGGGAPIGAYGGRRNLMEQIAPAGPVYQAGTLSGNPLSVAAGIATLRALDESSYPRLDALGARLAHGLEDAAKDSGVPLRVQRVGSMFTPFFTDRGVVDLATAKTTDAARYAKFFHAMLARGVLLPPSPFEAAFVGLAHTEADVDEAIAAARAALKEL
ncbi:MAG TPA: aminotransferase class III-fold pyridoxal phosphate-dependent enzyme, partial [Actinomycetota bacterium]|nr:aminotransferase class III-fold pyridoxal phosphate-dependent enzyme [Actinomycetota bacterium]